MKRQFLSIVVVALSILSFTPSLASEPLECVIVLHGMGRTHASMGLIESRLQNEGYAVWNKSYASTSEALDVLADSAVGSGLKYCEALDAPKIHFVTHSLGGILVRIYLQGNHIKNLGRIVMLAPPNHGSEIAELLKEYSVYEMTMGPAGLALGTGPDSVPNQLQAIEGEIGIIAGNFTSDPWFSPLIPGEDDGKVSVERTKLKEMKDFLVVDSGHTFMMRNDEVIDQVILFLRHGEFDHTKQ